MRRWIGFIICAISGMALFLCGLLVPAHLRAVDAAVLERAGRNTPSLIETAFALLHDRQIGPAQTLSLTAREERIPYHSRLSSAVDRFAARDPAAAAWGAPAPQLQRLIGLELPREGSEPLTDLMVRLTNREKVLSLLRASPDPAIQELLRFQSVTNTAIFSPSDSSSGQALDTALALAGCLILEGRLSPELTGALAGLAAEANGGDPPQRFEQALLDLMSLGRRLNFGQLAAFVAPVRDPDTLGLLANLARNTSDGLPVLYSAVVLSGDPTAVADYLSNHSRTGLNDLGAALRSRTGGLHELLRRGQPLSQSQWRDTAAQYNPFGAFFVVARDYSLRLPWFAVSVKWLLYLAGGFLLAAALHFAWPAPSALEQPLQVRGFHLIREFLFALGFLLAVLLLTEPFLAQESQKVDFSFRLQVPTVGAAVPTETPRTYLFNMTQSTLLTLLLFFVLQALLYTACLFKLAEIRRQRVSARMKLKLLENEDHLFDAGLYLGFFGTIVSLILVLLGVFKQPGLMVAYASTSFGILFVLTFKVLHLRRARRQLLMEADGQPQRIETPTHKLAAPL